MYTFLFISCIYRLDYFLFWMTWKLRWNINNLSNNNVIRICKTITWSVLKILHVCRQIFFADGFSIGLGNYIACFQEGISFLRTLESFMELIFYLSQHQNITERCYKNFRRWKYYFNHKNYFSQICNGLRHMK